LNENHKNQVKEFHPTIEEEKEVAPKIYTTKRGDKISWKATTNNTRTIEKHP
jgi:LysM repeat protein